MTTAISAIQAALYAHLKAAPLPKPMRIAPEGRNFDPNGTAYLRPTFLPAEPVGASIPFDGAVDHSGLYQIDVFWPENRGIGDPLAVVAALCTHYRPGITLAAREQRVLILRPPAVQPALQEPGWLQIPVRVTWTAYVDEPADAL
ncbi:phage tail terminator-like protein [Methylobacterium sp. JK268]